MVAADRVAATVIQGVHGRRRVGQGDAFWQYRPYRDGDSAQPDRLAPERRSRHLFVRETEWEAAASVWLWRDASPSMQYASLQQHRHQGGARRADHPGAGQPAGRRRRARGRAGQRHAADLGTRSPCAASPRRCTTRTRDTTQTPPSLPPLVPLPAHGTVVLVSDWLDPLDKIEAVIRHYASGGVRGHLVQVLDPAEEDLPFDGHVKFEGLEAEGQHTIRRVEAGAHRLRRAAGGAEGRPAAPDALGRLDGPSASHRPAAADRAAVALSRHGRPASAGATWRAEPHARVSARSLSPPPACWRSLLALPVIYWLLRMIPPLPRLVRFPAIRLLIGLEPTEQTPMKMPWWLLLLRLLLATALILAVRWPLLNPQADLPGNGPLLLVIDDGWSSAPG